MHRRLFLETFLSNAFEHCLSFILVKDTLGLIKIIRYEALRRKFSRRTGKYDEEIFDESNNVAVDFYRSSTLAQIPHSMVHSLNNMNDTVRVEVVKKKNESSASLIRRFTRRVQGSGIVRKMRSRRYHARDLSKNVEHKKKMISLRNKVKYEDLLKMGKIDPMAPRTRGRR